MDYRLIALDIDGTLTNSEKQISTPTLEALLDIQQSGSIVVIASGRPAAGVRELADELKLDKYGSYVLSYNGGLVTNWRTKETVYKQTLPQSVIPELYDFAIKNNVGIITYENDIIIAGTSINKYMQLEADITKMEIKQVDNFSEYVSFPVIKCLMSGEPELIEGLEKKLKKKYKSLLNIFRSEPFFLEIVPKNIDKAQSLLRLLSSLGLSSEQMICCGDGFNDISMIEIAGLGVAMENAQEVVKAAADFVTDSNDDNGILRVINKFMKSPL
ncbi:MAG: HAD family phosphatase [Lachnospiraceae bacterium]|nr:HAD family phosphatase [Lachnospiraceae bacterium]